MTADTADTGVAADELSPIKYTVEQNNADICRRATRACRCGGTLFDWGAGHSEGFDFINWHCNACPDVATEYLSPGRLHAIRNREAAADAIRARKGDTLR